MMEQALQEQRVTKLARILGTVMRASGPDIPPEKRYGFIRDEDGKDWYFGAAHVEIPTVFPREGDIVSFVPQIRNVPGKCDRATYVRHKGVTKRSHGA